MKNNKWLSLAIALSAVFLVGLPIASPALAAKEKVPMVGPVTLNAHPKSLEGKTVVLRWNSKFNGDKFLDRLGELLAQKVPKIKIVKMYQLDPSTVAVSKDMDESLKTAAKIAERKPDLVIASQADCGHCTAMLVVDQLNLEKKGIPTVTVTTTAYEKVVKASMKEQGISEMPLVTVQHPIGGRNDAETKQLVDGAFAAILTAATPWQPSK
ncbi:MAG: hypothetical protein LLG93_14400 [Deltaproteobacteria bacterium]|nr:hypothetical protein [Deltaproteobacteria bacterium]